jgi:hypothetical protein
MRLHSLVIMTACSLSVPLIAQNQNVYPLSPISPTTPQECQAYGAEIDQISSAYLQAHEKCLADHNRDQSADGANAGPLVCSRSACQSLHDVVYGNQKKEARARLDECNQNVQNHLRQEQEEQAAQQRAIQAQVSSINAQTEAANAKSQHLEQLAAQERSLADQRSNQAAAFREQIDSLRQQGIQVDESSLEVLQQQVSHESVFGEFADSNLPPAQDVGLGDYLANAKERISDFLQEKIAERLKEGLPDWAGDTFGDSARKVTQATENTYDLYSEGKDVVSLWQRIADDDASDSARAIGESGALAADHVFSNPIQRWITKNGAPIIGGTYGNAFAVLDGSFQQWHGGTPDAATAEMMDDYSLIIPGVKDLRAFNVRLNTTYEYFKNLFGGGSNP